MTSFTDRQPSLASMAVQQRTGASHDGVQLAIIAPAAAADVLPDWWPALLQLPGVSAQLLACHVADGICVVRLAATALPTRAQVDAFARPHGLDVGLLPQTPRWPRAMVFDMDSTLIHQECIDELAKLAGSGEQVAAITEAAMRGELDFNGALIARVATLKGLPATAIDQVIAALTLQPGIAAFAARARDEQVLLSLVSGGFVPFAEHVRMQLGFHRARANVLAEQDGRLTGTVLGEIVNAGVKAATLHAHCAELGCSTREVVAVGDGANDRDMARAAGLSVAFRAKPALRDMASICLDHFDFRALSVLFDSARKSALQ